ncbi:hypothetical protein [Cryptosporangium japonicum]|uniref:Uncharacterized protein n=1 Tax=Cryptosporangium japonicum TaxID=80872 RepID=A0ABP3ESE2_9ACTN
MGVVGRFGCTEQLIGAVVPDLRVDPETVPAPLTVLPSAALPTGEFVLDVARVDRSGRFPACGVLSVLGWEFGWRIEVDAVHGAVVIRRAASGRRAVDGRGSIPLPVAVRDLCGIAPAGEVVLAASAVLQVLVVHPAAIVARLLSEHHVRLLGGW